MHTEATPKKMIRKLSGGTLKKKMIWGKSEVRCGSESPDLRCLSKCEDIFSDDSSGNDLHDTPNKRET